MSMGCTSTRPRPDSWLVDCPFSLWSPWRHEWGNEWATYQSAIRTLACINMLIFSHNLGNSPIEERQLVKAKTLISLVSSAVIPARTALCAWNSRPPTHSTTSQNKLRSNNEPRSSLSRQSGTFTGVQLDWPATFTVSPTTLTYQHISTTLRHLQRNQRYTKHHPLLVNAL